MAIIDYLTKEQRSLLSKRKAIKLNIMKQRRETLDLLKTEDGQAKLAERQADIDRLYHKLMAPIKLAAEKKISRKVWRKIMARERYNNNYVATPIVVDSKVKTIYWSQVTDNNEPSKEITLNEFIEKITRRGSSKRIWVTNSKVFFELLAERMLRRDYEASENIWEVEGKQFGTSVRTDEINLLRIKNKSDKMITLLSAERYTNLGFDSYLDAIHVQDKLEPLKLYTYLSAQEELSTELKYHINRYHYYIKTALKILKDHGLLLSKSTIAQNALAYFKTNHVEDFNKIAMLTPEQDTIFRQAYRPAITYLNPDKKDKPIDDVTEVDVNSMYPHIMLNNVFPVGEPIELTDPYEIDDYLLSGKQGLISLRLKLSSNPLKTAGFDPFKLKSGDTVVSTAIYNEMHKYYNIKSDSIVNAYFWEESAPIFKNYITHFKNIKEHTSKRENRFKYMVAKTYQNSIYGMFARRSTFQETQLELDSQGFLTYVKGDKKDVKPLNVAIAIFVMDYANVFMLDAISKVQSIEDIELVKVSTDAIMFSGAGDVVETELVEIALGTLKKNVYGYFDYVEANPGGIIFHNNALIHSNFMYTIYNDDGEIINKKSAGANRIYDDIITRDGKRYIQYSRLVRVNGKYTLEQNEHVLWEAEQNIRGVAA